MSVLLNPFAFPTLQLNVTVLQKGTVVHFLYYMNCVNTRNFKTIHIHV